MSDLATRTDRPGTAEPALDEHQLRIQLAAAYRLAEKFGMSEIISTHISLRASSPPGTFLLNPNGLLFSKVTASNLVKVDFAGNVVGHSDWKANRAAVAIHGGVLEARPDVNCVVHTHTPYCTAVSSLECGLLPMTQAALRFNGLLAYHDYGRAATDPLERSRLAEDLGDKWVMLLRNHGALTTGKTLGEAFMAAFYLEKACQFQILAQSAGVPIVMPADQTRVGSAHTPGVEEPGWIALVQMLDDEDPSYRD